MDFDYLRLIALDERESGKLSQITPDTFKMAQEYLSELYEEGKSIDLFMTKRGSELIEEIESLRSLIQAIIDERFKKIIKLAAYQIESGKVDKNELEMMIPTEKEMFDEILHSIGNCRKKLTEPEIPKGYPEISKARDETAIYENKQSSPTQIEAAQNQNLSNMDVHDEDTSESGREHVFDTIYIKENIESFMGIDGHIYNLSKEDIVTLPHPNSSVLCGRNIALNIRVSK
ncbi:DNA replication complex GINS family protein [Methanoplanus sp. FWC-SCC4]|uniref:DNA replication complex GINS family protein n=1 Tax=Methanochimaera problematica TaxID=2609417 RepID=A0AA97FD46_9EURY|nr:hypothetical protein [Methanoplanus sp. FWC-SCC4]WOF15848.1 DNA replication complex GINS family protein [Methanoplanus sp. FWC-SCC4]